MTKSFLKIFVIFLFIGSINSTFVSSQDKPTRIRINSSLHTQTGEYKVSEAQGFGLGAQMKFRVRKKLDFNLNVNYNYSFLEQNDVLDEWEWDYWEDTYIDFIPGAEPEIINKTLLYTSTDSIYSAVFDPTQRLQELKLSLGFDYTFQLTKRLSLYFGFDGGFSLFFRELKMQEHWTKRFKTDSLSSEKFDYEFNYDLLHFAPTKKGNKFYTSTFVGTKFYLSNSLDLDMGVHYVNYFHRDKLLGINFSENARRWFPIKSKVMIAFGLTFKY